MEERWVAGLAVIVGFAGLANWIWLKDRIHDNSVVSIFDKDKYLGLWYVVARLPTRIEQHLHNITEEYILNADGSMNVIARAYHSEKNQLLQTTGKMKFRGEKNTGKLQVAYHLPIYHDYNVLDVDENYRYALVSGSSSFSLSILSRETHIPKYIKLRFLEKAEVLGFDIQQLQWIE